MKYLADVVSLEYSEEKCTGCGMCVEVCPRGVFELKARKAEITDRDLCIECGACALNCEFGAITVDAGVGCAAAVIKGARSGTEPCCCDSDDAACC